MNRVIDCLGLGIAPIDILLQIPRYPQPGAKIDTLNITIQGGGPIPTAMVTLSCLGLKTGLIAAVGEDILGDFVIEELESKGVDTSLIMTKKNSTAIAVGWVEYNSGRRTIALNLKIQIKARDIRIGKLPTARSVHLDGRDLPACMKLARWAQNNNIPVIFDIGSIRNDVTPILPLVNHLVCAEDFAFPFTGTRTVPRAIASLSKLCRGTIVVTSGLKGSLGYEPPSGYFSQKAFKTKAVDTTGAGDVFHGAYIFGLLKGWSLKRRLELASAAAAIKCTRPGGRAGIPNLKQVQSFLRKGCK